MAPMRFMIGGQQLAHVSERFHEPYGFGRLDPVIAQAKLRMDAHPNLGMGAPSRVARSVPPGVEPSGAALSEDVVAAEQRDGLDENQLSGGGDSDDR